MQNKAEHQGVVHGVAYQRATVSILERMKMMPALVWSFRLLIDEVRRRFPVANLALPADR